MNISKTNRSCSPERTPGAIWLLAAGTFTVGTDAFVVAGFLPRLGTDLSVSVQAAGASVTVFAISYAVLAPLLAAFTTASPRRRLLVVALLVLAAANVGTAIAPIFTVFLLCRVIAAAGAAMFTPNAGSVAASLVAEHRRGRSLGLVISGLTVATAVGVPLGSIASQLMSWRTALLCVAGSAAAVAVGLAVRLPQLPEGHRIRFTQHSSVLRRAGVRPVLLTTVLGMAAGYTAYAYTLPALESFGVTGETAVWLLFFYGVGAVSGAQLSGRLTDRWGGSRVLGVGYLTMSVALVALGAMSVIGRAPVAVSAILVFVWGASTWCQTPAQQHRLFHLAQDQASLAIALNASCIYIGIGLGTLIGGIFGAGHTSWMFFSGAGIAALTLTAVTATSRRSVPKVHE